jgi:hypothetical protein
VRLLGLEAFWVFGCRPAFTSELVVKVEVPKGLPKNKMVSKPPWIIRRIGGFERDRTKPRVYTILYRGYKETGISP